MACEILIPTMDQIHTLSCPGQSECRFLTIGLSGNSITVVIYFLAVEFSESLVYLEYKSFTRYIF